MENTTTRGREQAALGQKYAYATISLVLGAASFVNLFGIEKGMLAIVFGMLALRAAPGPTLVERRSWGKLGVALGLIQIVLVIAVIALNFDKLLELIRLLERFGEGR
jgi:hypothetical protein